MVVTINGYLNFQNLIGTLETIGSAMCSIRIPMRYVGLTISLRNTSICISLELITA